MRAIALVAFALASSSPAFAASAIPTHTPAGAVAPKPPLKLSDEQKQMVVQAINGRDSLDKLPDGFTPTVGAKVPTQKKLAEHPMPSPLIQKVPVLKQYYYVQLADRVLIVDPMSHTVADIVQR
jgi:hypothetical protein